MAGPFYRTRPRLYALGAGTLLLGWSALDLVGGREPGEAAAHAMLGLGALATLLLPTPRTALAAHAATLLGLAALGIFSAGLFGYGRYAGVRLETLENLGHAAIGAWGAYVASNE